MPASFRRTFIVVLAVLAVLVAAVATLDRLQGPKLQTAQIDTAAVVGAPHQSLRLFTSERITPVARSQVTVTPAVAFSVAAAGQQIVVQFTHPLSYSTNYHVAVARVTSADDGAVSALSYSFTTAAPDIYYLHRSQSSGPDQIFRTSLHGPGQTLMYSAPRIQDYTVFEGALAVVTLDAQGNSSLFFVGATGTVTPITLPGAGTIDLVRGNRDTGILGFAFTSAGDTTKREYTSALFTVDPNATAVPRPVLGLDGKPLSVIDWDFVPATNYVAVQASDDSILLLDTTSPRNVVPLGSYVEFDAVATDGTSFTVSDVNGPISIAVPSGAHTRLVASRLGGIKPLGGAGQVLPVGWLQVDSVYDKATGGFTEHLVFDNGTVARQLYTTPNARGSIDSFQDSPNNEYVSIETTPDVASAKPDGYQVDGRSTSVTTVFVDIATGALVKTVAGFDVSW